MRQLPRLVFLLVLGLPLIFAGCIERQMRRMQAPDSKGPQEVLQAAKEVLQARYYQVKQASPFHLVALTPIDLNANSYTRNRIDIYIFQENGFYMPDVTVRTYLETSEPPMPHTGPQGPADSVYTITPRFPRETVHVTAPNERWEAIYLDRTLALDIRNAILKRLNIPT